MTEALLAAWAVCATFKWYVAHLDLVWHRARAEAYKKAWASAQAESAEGPSGR